MTNIPIWQVFETMLTSATAYDNPPQQAQLTALFTAPSGAEHRVYGFWDGDSTWRIRFAPDEQGTWKFQTICSDENNSGLHAQSGEFECGVAEGSTIFDQHGAIRVSENRRYFVHADGTPFFWLGDTAWNGPLLSTDDEWAHYLAVRSRQGFTAVQWAATQWLASPEGDVNGDKAYTGNQTITINPAFFQRLDAKHKALNAAGMLSIPVLLWAAEWTQSKLDQRNPGVVLPEDQAILLARYMVARWDAYAAAYFLPGDGPYLGERAERWKRIGQAVFGEITHSPVTLHPMGMQWIGPDFDGEDWLDYIGYQSGHGDDNDTIAWLVEGPPVQDWKRLRPRPFINLEPPYEGHVAYQSKMVFDEQRARRGLYWSLLNAPTVGVSYGGHGVWGWDDGSGAPEAHPDTGTPLPWRQALEMPAAETVPHLHSLFTSLTWWRLRSAQHLLAEQPGAQNKEHFVSAACTEEGDLALVYTPVAGTLKLKLDNLQAGLSAVWFDPRAGQRTPTAAENGAFSTPGAGDWALLLTKE